MTADRYTPESTQQYTNSCQLTEDDYPA